MTRAWLWMPAAPYRRRRYVEALALPVLLSGCGGVLDPQGPIGLANRTIMLDALAIMLAIVVPTILAALGFAWWFRASNARAVHRPTWSFSGRIELLVWSIPILVILFLGGVIWIGSHQLDPAQPIASRARPIEVQVVSLDWKWLFIYPDQGIASINRLVVPVGVPVRFSLTSASVMNSFFVPQLGSMIYTMNGMVTHLHLQADRAASYYGQSAHFSGDGFSDMHFQVQAVPPADFTRWIGATRRNGPVLDRRAYDALAVQSRTLAPLTYRAVDPALFRAIVMQTVPQAPGPTPGKDGAPPAHPTEMRHAG